jgi:uncharacterized protein (DUF697 family)
MNKKNLPRAIRPETTQVAPVQPVHLAEARAPDPVMTQAAAPDAAETKDRRARAIQVVKRLSLWAGAAGLIPIPLADLAAVGGVQVEMLRRISKIYGVSFSQNSGKALIAGIAGSMIPASSGIGAASLIKGMPLVGTVISMVTMPTLSVGATYAIGMAFIQHFESGGTLLDFNPPDYREFLKPQPRRSGAQAV